MRSGRYSKAVVLVHGLWLAGWCMVGLSRQLKHCGFDTRHNFSYPSVTHNLLENAEALHRYVRSLEASAVHLVGHSLGGLVIRALFHLHPDQPPGRVVTLGSPHRGSYPAAMLTRTALGRRITGRSIQQLLAGMPDYWSLPDRDFGVIAGDLSIGMGVFFPGLPRPNDGVVTLEEAYLPGATDSVTVHVSHSALVLSANAGRQVCHFLKTGRFDRDH
ncbi:MAG: esterase/lipase family protein [Acidiferrobacterales bacterium]